MKYSVWLVLLIGIHVLPSYATGKKKVASTNVSSVPKTNTPAPTANPLFFTPTAAVGTVTSDVTQPEYAPLIPSGNEFYEILGLPFGNSKVQELINGLSKSYQQNAIESNIVYTCYEKGFAFVVNSKNYVEQVHFFSNKYFLGSAIMQYPYALPQDISFEDTREQIENKLGKPVMVSTPVFSSSLNANYQIDFENYTMIITYQTPNADDYAAKMEDIVLMKNDKDSSAVKSGTTGNTTPKEKTVDSEYLLYTFIGKINTDRNMSEYMSHMFPNYTLHNYSDCYEMSNADKGVSFTFGKNNALKSIRLFNNRLFLGEAFKQYEEQLPEQLSFNLTRGEIELKLGSPIEVSGTTNELTCVYKSKYPDLQLSITYNTHNIDDLSATINDIVVMHTK